MGDLNPKVKLDLVIHIKDERTSDKYVNFVALSLVIIFNLLTIYLLCAFK